eukprot:8780747-Pyramimonas_sp.AAC.1
MTSACPLCMSVFRSAKFAKRHAMAGFRRNDGRPGRARFEDVRSEPKTLQCPMCEYEADSGDILLEHCGHHLHELLPQNLHIRTECAVPHCGGAPSAGGAEPNLLSWRTAVHGGGGGAVRLRRRSSQLYTA